MPGVFIGIPSEMTGGIHGPLLDYFFYDYIVYMTVGFVFKSGGGGLY